MMSEFTKPSIGSEFGHPRPNCPVLDWQVQTTAAGLAEPDGLALQRRVWPRFKAVSALVKGEVPSIPMLPVRGRPWDRLTAAELLQEHATAKIYRGTAVSIPERPNFP